MAHRATHLAELGIRLSKRLASTHYGVYYDQGWARQNELSGTLPTPYFALPSRTSTLSAVDLVIVNRLTSEAELIVDVEDSGAEPKKLLGAVLNVALADAIRVGGERYAMGKAWLLLGIRANAQGGAPEKVARLSRQLTDRAALPPGFRWETEIDETVSGLIVRLERRLSRVLGLE
jgi:hypothetical protein